MLVDTFLRYTNARLKNKAAFKHLNRLPKIRRKLMKKQMDLAFKILKNKQHEQHN
jgi:hypothetical protein